MLYFEFLYFYIILPSNGGDSRSMVLRYLFCFCHFQHPTYLDHIICNFTGLDSAIHCS